MPMRLWSTVVSQLHRPVGSAWPAAACARCWSSAVVAIRALLLVSAEVGDEQLGLVGLDAEIGHQHTLLHRLRVLDPPGEVLVGVLEAARADVRSGADVGEVGAD